MMPPPAGDGFGPGPSAAFSYKRPNVFFRNEGIHIVFISDLKKRYNAVNGTFYDVINMKWKQYMDNKNNFLMDFKSAIMFITIFPAGKNVPFSPMGMIRFFPVVGLIIGCFLAGVNHVFSFFWQTPVVAVLDVLFLVAVTGAFHLDGLGDAADGLFSHRSKQRTLEIMKDSRTGMMGLVAIFCTLAVKTAGIYSINTSCTNFETMILFFIIPSYARGGMLFGIRYLKYGRENTGTGHDFFKESLELKNFIPLVIPVGLSLFLGAKGLLLIVVFCVSTFLILWFYKKKMGCITGDMLGAMTEITEAVLFLWAGAALI